MSFVALYIWNPLKNLQQKSHEQNITWNEEYLELEKTHKDYQSPISGPA